MKPNNSGGRGYLKYAGVGFEFAAVVGVCFYVGYRADQRWGWDPWGLLLGGAIGLAAGIYLLVKESSRMLRDFESESDHKNDDRNN